MGAILPMKKVRFSMTRKAASCIVNTELRVEKVKRSQFWKHDAMWKTTEKMEELEGEKQTSLSSCTSLTSVAIAHTHLNRVFRLGGIPFDFAT